jgi:hypothetical protein
MRPNPVLFLVFILLISLSTACQPAETPGAEPVEANTTAQPEGMSESPQEVGAQPSPTATPEADPRVELGSPDWKATFSQDTEQTWGQFSDQQATVEMLPDKLVLTSQQSNSFDTWSMSYPVLDDFYLELVGTTGEACSGKDRFGPIVRSADNNQGYLFQISCDGMFQLRNWDGQQFTDLVKWTPDEHIVTGPNQTHRVGFMAEGPQLSVYVNGFLLAEVQDESYSQGKFGVSIAAAETPGYTVEITDAVYWELP